MDSSILQLFEVDEILERVGRQKLTGCFHAFAPKESANLFFKDGVVFAAVKANAEGEPVLKQILSWKGARYFWEPNAVPPTPPAKLLNIPICDYLLQGKPPDTKPVPKPVVAQASNMRTSSMPVISVGAKGKSTGPLYPEPIPVKANLSDNTATTSLAPTAEAKAAQEEALLRKFRFNLLPVDQPTKTRLQISRVSNVVGRNGACDIAVPHPSISRQHCLVQITERGLHVKDLGTTNGTKVNGITLHEGYISPGDKLTLGHLTFLLEKE